MKESFKNFYNYDASDEEIRKYHTEENYLNMIAERIKELKNLQLEFMDPLWNQDTSGT